jgi:two-component system nitrogen regulation response regulator GlnG
MTAPRVLVVDDRDTYIRLCHRYLRDAAYVTRCDLAGPCWDCAELERGCALTHAHGWVELDETLRRQREPVDVILLDVDFQLPWDALLPRDKPSGPTDREAARLRRYQGIEILRELRRVHGSIPVILMTAYEDLAFEEDADALAAEEYTYFAGEETTDARALGLLIERVAARHRPGRELEGFFWGAAEVMTRLRQRAEILARGDRPILVLGETGTGKSLLAERVIHPATRRSGRFCSVDLSAIPETLVASELFGTDRGAFSGAADRAGRFEHADGGSLLLDEIGHLPSEVQRALLAVLQDRRVTRLGSNEPRQVDVKLVAATNEDLERRVREGAFRSDLLMRLNPAARLVMPPLRERRQDIPALIEVFVRRCFHTGGNRAMLEEYVAAVGLGRLKPSRIGVVLGAGDAGGHDLCFSFQRKTVDGMLGASWPGNVRQLELVVESAVVTALADALRAAGALRVRPRVIPVGAKLVRDLIQAGDAMGGAAETPGAGELRVTLRPAANLRDVSRDVERQYMGDMYQRTGGDFDRMAELLLGEGGENARRVRLRFNQLGLRVRKIRLGG